MSNDFDETSNPDLTADEEALLRELPSLTDVGHARRKFMEQSIEGLAQGDQIHPMQAAFIKNDGFQCGYCTPGQICSAVAMLTEAKNGEASYVTADVRQKPSSIQLTDDEIRERMSGNICRCGAYPNIIRAIQEVHSGKQAARTWSFHKPQTKLADAINDVLTKEAISDATV